MTSRKDFNYVNRKKILRLSQEYLINMVQLVKKSHSNRIGSYCSMEDFVYQNGKRLEIEDTFSETHTQIPRQEEPVEITLEQTEPILFGMGPPRIKVL